MRSSNADNLFAAGGNRVIKTAILLKSVYAIGEWVAWSARKDGLLRKLAFGMRVKHIRANDSKTYTVDYND